MRDSSIKLKDVVGHDVSADEAGDVVEYLLACLTHVTNARPLFGVLNTDTAALEWSAGGADFHDVLKDLAAQHPGGANGVMSFLQLFMCFGISSGDIVAVVEQMNALEPGASMSMVQPMDGAQDRSMRMVLRRRREPNQALVQFSLLDITAFQASSKRTQTMAQELVVELDAPIEAEGADDAGARARLLSVLDGLDGLFECQEDATINLLAQNLSAHVTTVSERMVELLRGFEERFPTSHWQPEDLDPGLRPVIPVHSAPVSDWRDLHREILIEVEGEPALRGLDSLSVKNAYDFVSYAASTLAISPVAGEIFALNGTAGGQVFTTVEDFVRALGVEENSTRTAVEYFEGLGDAPALGLFAMEGHNVEAWGRPGQYGGWQVMLVPAQGQGVDVRGLFHGLKNLLLHLQVLYVVNKRSDVDQVHAGLSETAQKIRSRLDDLQCVARTGRRGRSHVVETVQQWLDAALKVGNEEDGNVLITTDGVADLRFAAVPGEMEDTLEELVRNAFLHDASEVRIGAMQHSGHLCLLICDNGRGMSEEKLGQLRRVLETRDYDASLSTRKGGTGNGLLAAANAVSRFVDGRFSVNHGPEGTAPGNKGVEITISMKLPG